LLAKYEPNKEKIDSSSFIHLFHNLDYSDIHNHTDQIL